MSNKVGPAPEEKPGKLPSMAESLLQRPAVDTTSVATEVFQRDISASMPLAHLLELRSHAFNTGKYFLFLVLFSGVAMAGKSGDEAFYFADSLKALFIYQELPYIEVEKQFPDIGQIEEFWQWVEGVLVPRLYPTEYYNSDPLPAAKQRWLYSNRILGAVRMRQVRVRDGTCDTIRQYGNAPDGCFGAYDSNTADTAPFGPNNTYTYKSDKSFPFFARVYQYGGDGYGIDFPAKLNATVSSNSTYNSTNSTSPSISRSPTPSLDTSPSGSPLPANVSSSDSATTSLSASVSASPSASVSASPSAGPTGSPTGSNGTVLVEEEVDQSPYANANTTQDVVVAMIADLKKNSWIDKQTRAVFIDFTMYNAHLNMFCMVRMTLEILPSGSLVTFPSFRTLKLLRYTEPSDWATLAFEILLIVLVIGYYYEEGWAIYDAMYGKGAYAQRHWKGYFLDDKWNYLTLLMLILFLCVISFRIVSVIFVNRLLATEAFQNDSAFVNFQDISWVVQNEYNFNALNILICWMKSVKFLGYMPRINFIMKAIYRAAPPMVKFVVVFFIVFVAFGISLHMVFATSLYQFRTIPLSMQSLVQFILNQYDFNSLQFSNRILGPFVFFMFMFVVTLAMVNVFIAILSHAFDLTQDEDLLEREGIKRQAAVNKFLGNKIDKSLKARFKRGLAIARRAMRAEDHASHISRRVGGKDGIIDFYNADQLSDEALKLLRQYDDDDDDNLSRNELMRFLEDLEKQKRDLEMELSKMVDMEAALGEGWIAHRKREAEHAKMHAKVDEYVKKASIFGADAGYINLRYHPPKSRLVETRTELMDEEEEKEEEEKEKRPEDRLLPPDVNTSEYKDVFAILRGRANLMAGLLDKLKALDNGIARITAEVEQRKKGPAVPGSVPSSRPATRPPSASLKPARPPSGSIKPTRPPSGSVKPAPSTPVR